MEVAKGESSLNSNSEIDIMKTLYSIKRPRMVRVKIESESEDEQESPTAEHVIKEGMVIGSMVLQAIHHNSNYTKDTQKHLQPVVLLERLERTIEVPVQNTNENQKEPVPAAAHSAPVNRPTLKVVARYSKTCVDMLSTAGSKTRIIRELKPKSRLKINMAIVKKPERENTDSTSDFDNEKPLKYLEINNKAQSNMKDAPLRNKPKLDGKIYQEDVQKETTKETGMEEEIAVTDADILLHKKPRLQTQEEITDRQENTNSDTEVEITSNVDTKMEALAYIQIEQKDKIKGATKKSRPSNKSKTHREIQVEDKNFNRVTSDNIFTCDDCGECYKRKRELMQHIESHEEIKYKTYLKCKECTYQTFTRDSFKRHKRVHDKSRRYVCDVCGYRYKRKDILRTHLHCVHSGEWVNKCGICDYRTDNIVNLNAHLRTHSDEKPYSCSLCEYKCKLKVCLTSHMIIHTGKKPFSCTLCEYRCDRKLSLTNHMMIHTGEKPFSCTVCEYRCTDRSSLIRHVRIHRGEKPFSCTVCEYRCITKSNLKIHMKIHTGEKPFSCTVCEYRCSQKGNLSQHMKIHTGEKPFSCTMCDYRFIHKVSLINHICMVHRGEKPFSCTVCEYKCTRKGDLNKHMKIHTGEKPFSCTVCDKRFTDKSNLTKHMMIHTGEKPFSCTVCEYRCILKGKLTQHMQIHAGEKPFSCSICAYKCATKSNLTRHIGRNHNK